MAEGEVQNQSGESLEDRVFTFAAMAGAVGGAIGGTVLGAAVGTAYPIACGALGTMLGSGVTAGGWCLLVRLWSVFTRSEAGRDRFDAVGPPLATPGSSAR